MNKPAKAWFMQMLHVFGGIPVEMGFDGGCWDVNVEVWVGVYNSIPIY